MTSSNGGDRKSLQQKMPATADEHLAVLGYTSEFRREMTLWANISLGFTYLSPLVGVYSLFAYGLSLAGPPAVWWLVIVGLGQFTVALVFGEVASQYPVAGGLYQWVRRLANRKAAWLVSWVYALAMIVTVTSVAEFGGAFVAPLFGFTNTPETGLITAIALLAVALVLNFTGTRTMALVAQIGLTAELVGVIALGCFLLLFKRENSISVLFDSMGAMGAHSSYLSAFLAAALTGLWLFYGFEACGNVAEEVADPGRRVPSAMRFTILIGGVSAGVSFLGYLLAAPNLKAIVAGEVADPIPAILEGALGHVGAKVFLLVALMSFVSCVLSLQAAASRLIYSFARDKMTPASSWLSKVSIKQQVPTNALLVACVVPVLLCVWVRFSPGALAQITAFAVLGIYISFQTVVFCALRMRLRGWRPAGEFALGKWGLPVNVVALVYGIASVLLLAWPRAELSGVDRYLPLLGAVVVLGTGALYLLLARPDRHSTGPEGDALEIADKLRELRGSPSAG
jgi:amino acid transporter